MRDLIILGDIFGVDGNLFVKDKKSKHQNLFGGVISILTICLMLAGGLYFFDQFVKKENFTIISSQTSNLNSVYPKLNEIPFMIRISGEEGVLFSNSQSIWVITFGILSYDASISSTQSYQEIDMEPCSDLNIANFTNLFANLTDVETYWCPNWGNSTFDMYGTYGQNTKFSYAMAYLTRCSVLNGNNNCFNETTIDYYLSDAYVDLITIDYEITPYTDIPYNMILNTQRFPVSSSVFKRIWFSFSQITYTTDTGIIFEDNKSYKFNQVSGSTVDVDLRTDSYGDFAWLTITNTNYSFNYLRSYMKVQTLLANVGGIINGLSIIATIICYTISDNLHNISLANNISLNIISDKENDKLNTSSLVKTKRIPQQSQECDFSNNNINRANTPVNIIKNINGTSSMSILQQGQGLKNNFINSKNDNNQNDNNLPNKYLPTQTETADVIKINQSQLNFSNLEIICPSFCCSKKQKKQAFNRRIQIAEKYLNIYNILTSVQEINLLKNI